jgi:hypothetical protein
MSTVTRSFFGCCAMYWASLQFAFANIWHNSQKSKSGRTARFVCGASSAPSIAVLSSVPTQSEPNSKRDHFRHHGGALRRDHSEGRQVQQTNFASYQMLRMHEVRPSRFTSSTISRRQRELENLGLRPSCLLSAPQSLRKPASACASYRSTEQHGNNRCDHPSR